MGHCVYQQSANWGVANSLGPSGAVRGVTETPFDGRRSSLEKFDI